MNIAFIVDSLAAGGAEKHTLQLYEKLSDFGFDTELVYLKSKNEIAQNENILKKTFWCANFKSKVDILGLYRLFKWIRASRPAVLICVSPYSLFYGYVAKVMSGVDLKIISINHSTVLPYYENIKMYAVKWIYNRCEKNIYVSNLQMKYWCSRGWRSDLAEVIHNGIDVVNFVDIYSDVEKNKIRSMYAFKETDFVIGICAALRPEKKHEDLLLAIKNVKKIKPNVKCLVIGDGPRRKYLDNEIVKLGLTECVRISGFKNDVRPYISICNVIALVSHQVETFSIAALEAMSLEKSIVISDIGGAREQIKNGINGYIYPVGNIDELTEKLLYLTNSDLAMKFGTASRSLVISEFDEKIMLKKYGEIISKCYMH